MPTKKTTKQSVDHDLAINCMEAKIEFMQNEINHQIDVSHSLKLEIMDIEEDLSTFKQATGILAAILAAVVIFTIVHIIK